MVDFIKVMTAKKSFKYGKNGLLRLCFLVIWCVCVCVCYSMCECGGGGMFVFASCQMNAYTHATCYDS